MRKDPYAKERAALKLKMNDPMSQFYNLLLKNAKGEKGDTPVKGKDYFTPVERKELIADILERIPKPKDADEVDYDLVLSYVADQVEQKVKAEVAKIPKPKDGTPGKDAVVDIPAIITSLLKTMPKMESKEVDYLGIKEYIDKQIANIKSEPKVVKSYSGGGATALSQLTDVVLNGLTQDNKGNYILGGSGSSTFTDLTDTPAAYTSQGGKLVRVNTAEDALEFIDPPTGTGDVSGPASAVNEQIAVFDGTTGKLIKDGGATVAGVRDRSTHTGTQTAATISDFDTEVANNSAVAANTAKVTNATHTGDVTGATALTIANNAVTNAKAADMATATIKGRATAGTGNPEDLTATQVRTLINVADGATANSADATLLARANHTGTQTASTISDFDTEVANNSAVTANTAKVSYPGTADATELNILDGATVTTAELNVLDGITATTAELNHTDGVTSNIQTQLDAKAATASPTLTGTTTVDRIDYDRAVGTVSALGNLGATETIDWSLFTHFTGNLDSNITFTYSNAVSGQSITLYLAYSGAQRTITWPTTTWLDNATGAAPTAPATTGDVLVVTLQNIGGTIYGSATGNYAVYA